MIGKDFSSGRAIRTLFLYLPCLSPPSYCLENLKTLRKCFYYTTDGLSSKIKKKEGVRQNSIETEGTTPRRIEDVMASLADLVSGSADAGTPVILIKGFLG